MPGAMRRDPWSEAFTVAKELGLGYVGTDLLLLGLTRSDGVAAEVLRDLGATDEAVLAFATRFAQPPTSGETSGEPRLTPAAHHARGRAEGLALGLGAKQSSVHLLLALAYDRHGVHASALWHLGVDRGEIVRRLAAREVAVPPTPPAPDPAPQSDWLVLPHDQARIVAAELARMSTEDPKRFVDAWGSGMWGYGGIPDRPGDARISGAKAIGLRELVLGILRAKGLPEPPEDAWSSD